MLQDFFNPARISVKNSETLGAGILSLHQTKGEEPADCLAFFTIGGGFEATREKLYSLAAISTENPIYDLGEFKLTDSLGNNLAGISQVLQNLYEKKVCVFILSSVKEGDFAQWLAHKESSSDIDCFFASPSLQTDSIIQFRDDWSLPKNKKKVFHLSYTCHQEYLNMQSSYDTFESFFTDSMGVGEFRSNYADLEPLLRESDFACIDSAILRRSDFGQAFNQSPNGLYSEEFCVVARYAGISNTLRSASILCENANLLQASDHALLAQAAWYFIEGYESRFYDHPNPQNKEFQLLHCPVEGFPMDEIVFLRSLRTQRIWMQIGLDKKKWVGCTEQEYILASQNNVPEKWFRALHP